MRRGDIRSALLAGLSEGPAHGYELIGRLEGRSGGMWRPSAGSVYPTLQLLEEEGLIAGEDQGGKRVYRLTDEGRAEAESARERWGSLRGEEGGSVRGLRHSFKPLILAARQVALAGDQAQRDAAATVLDEARQKLYRILAGDAGVPGDDAVPGDASGAGNATGPEDATGTGDDEA